MPRETFWCLLVNEPVWKCKACRPIFNPAVARTFFRLRRPMLNRWFKICRTEIWASLLELDFWIWLGFNCFKSMCVWPGMCTPPWTWADTCSIAGVRESELPTFKHFVGKWQRAFNIYYTYSRTLVTFMDALGIFLRRPGGLCFGIVAVGWISEWNDTWRSEVTHPKSYPQSVTAVYKSSLEQQQLEEHNLCENEWTWTRKNMPAATCLYIHTWNHIQHENMQMQQKPTTQTVIEMKVVWKTGLTWIVDT